MGEGGAALPYHQSSVETSVLQCSYILVQVNAAEPPSHVLCGPVQQLLRALREEQEDQE